VEKERKILGVKRGVAYLIDCFVIFLFALLLFGASSGINSIWPFYHYLENSYVLRHLVSFSTLTLPALVYFIGMEHSRNKASIGKIALKLRVQHVKQDIPKVKNLIIRNAFKLLPWEIAHVTYLLNPEFFLTGEISNHGIIIGLGISYGLIFIYAGMVFLRADGRSLHDLLSNTYVTYKKSKMSYL